ETFFYEPSIGPRKDGLIMAVRKCVEGGQRWVQTTGRPSKRCRDCRAEQVERYGTEHKRLRKETLSQAYGQPCARCGEPMQPGQELHLDHADEGSGYIGFSHKRCNLAAGASKINKERAAAWRLYRATSGDVPAEPAKPPAGTAHYWPSDGSIN